MTEEKDHTEEIQEEKTEQEVERKSTLGELGLRLPIFFKGGPDSKERTFSFKEWDMEIEEKLSDLQESSKNTGEFVREMMMLLMDEFGGRDWEEIKKEEKILLLSQMEYPNMVYMYFALRVEEMGHELVFDSVSCPNCKKAIRDWQADLRTLDVICKDQGHPELKDLELKKPIHIGDGKTVTGLRFGVTKWSAMEKIPTEKAGNMTTVKRTMFESALQACLQNGKPVEGFVDPKTVIKKLKKADIERASKTVVEHNGGPDMVIGGECPHCKSEFVKVIEWSYDRFFESSSL